jgi:SAM-dependent methyltransferase
MKSTIYPAVGTYLKNSETKRVLDIGSKWYNINNRDFFFNSNIVYWVIDVNEKPKDLKYDHFLRVSILDLPDIYHNLESYFDVVISYGVLSVIKFDKKSIDKFLENVYRVLKPNGLFLLKLDGSLESYGEEFQVDLEVIHKYFTPISEADLAEEKLVSDGKVHYTFYTLRKKIVL